MKVVIQRVLHACVTLEDGTLREIENGILILLGIHETDNLELSRKLAVKCAQLRIFEDESGKMNLSALDLQYEAMVVSNFTLYADTKKGNRPSFVQAAKAPLSIDCYEEFIAQIKETGLKAVQTGEFGTDMKVECVNDGPVTIVIDTDDWKKERKE